MHQLHAHCAVPGGSAVVQNGACGQVVTEAIHGISAGLQLQRSGHAVMCLVALAEGRRRVAVQIDEAGGDHQTADVHHLCAG